MYHSRGTAKKNAHQADLISILINLLRIYWILWISSLRSAYLS